RLRCCVTDRVAARAAVGKYPIAVVRGGSVVRERLIRVGRGTGGDNDPGASVPALQFQVEVGAVRPVQASRVQSRVAGVEVASVGVEGTLTRTQRTGEPVGVALAAARRWSGRAGQERVVGHVVMRAKV